MTSIALDIPNTKVFGDLSREILAQGHRLRFQARGLSMAPAIHDGDILLVDPVSPADLFVGDIVLFAEENSFKAHRLIKINRLENLLITRADAGIGSGTTVSLSDVLGLVVAKEAKTSEGEKLVPFHGSLDRMRLHALRAKAYIGELARMVSRLRSKPPVTLIKYKESRSLWEATFR